MSSEQQQQQRSRFTCLGSTLKGLNFLQDVIEFQLFVKGSSGMQGEFERDIVAEIINFLDKL